MAGRERGEEEGRGEGRRGDFTAVGLLLAEAMFPGVWREFLGESCGREALESLERGLQVCAIWELARHSLLRVGGANSIGAGSPSAWPGHCLAQRLLALWVWHPESGTQFVLKHCQSSQCLQDS